jgi:hypothetical protein
MYPSLNELSEAFLLCINHGGKTLHRYSLSEVPTKEIDRVILPKSILRLWASQPGIPNSIVWLIGDSTMSLHEDFDDHPQIIYISPPNAICPIDDIDFNGRKFILLQNEKVLDVQWCPQYLSDDYRCEDDNFVYLLGVLTSFRVVILLAQFSHVNKTTESPLLTIISSVNCPSVPTISWLGTSLVYADSNSNISYVLPSFSYSIFSKKIRTSIDANDVDEYYRSDIKWKIVENGISMLEPSRNTYNFCSLPFHVTSLRALKVIACFPDRLVLAYPSASFNGKSVAIMLRPLTAAEPFLLGLTRHPICTTNQPSIEDNRIAKLFKAILSATWQYFPTLTSVNRTNIGGLPTAHFDQLLAIVFHGLSTVLSISLIQHKFFKIIAPKVLGLSLVSNPTFSSESFQICRWIANGLAFVICTESEIDDVSAVAALLISSPQLQELLLDSVSSHQVTISI